MRYSFRLNRGSTCVMDKSIFDNIEVAYRLHSKRDLWRSFVLFKLISFPILQAFCSMSLRFLMYVKVPIHFLLRHTIFAQFCVGETLDEAIGLIRKLYIEGVSGVLDFSVEGKSSEDGFDRVFKTTIQLLDIAQDDDAIPFVVFKPTGLGSADLYEKVSSQGVDSLTSDESALWQVTTSRFEGLAKKAYDNQVPLMVDAEESWINPAVDQLVRDLFQRYNTKSRIIIYSTVQAYLKNRLDYVESLHKDALEHNFKIGIKLVRGAYLEKERIRAQKYDYESPVHDTKEDSDWEYDAVMEYTLRNINTFGMYFGTHNIQSCLNALRFMEDYKIDHKHPHVWFGQLYGMRDHITFNLSAYGFNVSKYMPFGPVAETVPYLLRRAEENSSVKGQSLEEFTLVRREIQRRSKL